MRTKFTAAGGLVLGAVAGVLAFGASADAQEAKKLDVIIANDATCSLYPAHVARLTGMNAHEGIDVTLLSSETKVPYVAFLSTGDADYVMLDAHESLNFAEVGEPASVIYTTHQFAPEGIVVAADSPIAGLADLKGKTVGLADDADRLTTAIALDSVGMSIDDVTTAVVGDSGPVLAKSLIDGTIDAFAGGASDRTGIEAAGLTIRNITPSAVSENPGNNFVMANARKRELDGSTQPFLKTWSMAQHSGIMDTKATMSICREAIPEQFENMVTGERLIVNAAFGTQLRRTHDYGELNHYVWAKIQGPLQKMGIIKAFIEPSSFLDPQYIQAANAWSTAEVRGYLEAWKAANPERVIQ